MNKSELIPFDALHIGPARLSLPADIDFIPLRDSFVWGRCDTDPVRHRKFRVDHWRRVFRNKGTTFVQIPSDAILAAPDLARRVNQISTRKQIVVWTSLAWKDAVVFWWVLDALHFTGIPFDRVWLAIPFDLRSGQRGADLSAFQADQFFSAMTNAIPMNEGLWETGASLWRNFASDSPLAFETACAAGSEVFPNLLEVTRPYNRLFPRSIRGSPGNLLLSEADATLLGTLTTDSWTTVAEAIADGRTFSALSSILEIYDTCFLLHRLHEWATIDIRHSPVEQIDDPTAVSSFTKTRYRLTSFGRNLLDCGINTGDRIPAMFVGGSRVYDDLKLWVRCAPDQTWSLVLAPTIRQSE